MGMRRTNTSARGEPFDSPLILSLSKDERPAQDVLVEPRAVCSSFDRLRTSVIVVALALASTSCGDVVRAGRSPVFLVISTLSAARGSAPNTFFSSLLSDVVTNVT